MVDNDKLPWEKQRMKIPSLRNLAPSLYVAIFAKNSHKTCNQKCAQAILRRTGYKKCNHHLAYIIILPMNSQIKRSILSTFCIHRNIATFAKKYGDLQNMFQQEI